MSLLVSCVIIGINWYYLFLCCRGRDNNQPKQKSYMYFENKSCVWECFYLKRVATYSEKVEIGNTAISLSKLNDTQTFKMGASIGAENVGRMLFDEEIFKSGGGDVRVGATGRWKDFKGNEIVRNEKQDPE